MKYFTLTFFFLFSFFKVNAQSVGGKTSFENNDSVHCSTSNSGAILLSGYNGTIQWWVSPNGGLSWGANANNSSRMGYFNNSQKVCYTAVVTDGANSPANSDTACVEVFPPIGGLNITNINPSGPPFCGGSGSGTLKLAALPGTAKVLGWQSSINNGPTLNTPNLNDSLPYTNFTISAKYWAVLQNGPSNECPSNISDTATFNILKQTVPGVISVPPTTPTTVCASGNSGTMTLTGNTGSVKGWKTSSNGTTWSSAYTDIGSATKKFLDLADTTWYRIDVQNGPCAVLPTPAFKITVNPVPEAGIVSGAALYCGDTATGGLNVTGPFVGNRLGWISSTDSAATWTLLPNVNITYNYTNLLSPTFYAVVAENPGCKNDTAKAEFIGVYSQTVAGYIDRNDTVCSIANMDTLFVKGFTGSVRSWLRSSDNGITWVNIPLASDSLIFAGLTVTTMYKAIVQSGLCNIDTTASDTVTVIPLPSVYAGTDVTIYAGQSIVLNGSGTGVPSWTPTSTLFNANTFFPTATPTVTTTYVLTVTDKITNKFGCQNSDAVIVTINPNPIDVVPSNLFTPNGDGFNDTWYIEGISKIPDNEVFVYNIYGQLVFSQKDYNNEWKGTFDGNNLPDGTYYFVIKFPNSSRIERGSIDILRK